MKKKWIVTGYYYDGDNAWTLLIAADGAGKTNRIKEIA